MTTPEDDKRARALRRRHKHERQAVVFGVLIAFLAVSGLAAAAVYTGAIDPPFERGFTAAESQSDTTTPQPCLPPDTLPVPYSSVTVRVLNGTTRTGLASTVADGLKARGFVVESTGNSQPYASVQIAFGPAGLASAYTLAAHFPTSKFIFDDREDASLDVYIGNSFEDLVAPESVALDPAVAMTSVETCTAVENITPTPRATTAPPEAPADAPVEEAPAEVPAG